MSITQSPDQIDYPESDGKPMGETDLHRDWMFRILEILRHRYRGQPVYIASDLLVYYEEGSPTRFVVPDDFVVLDCNPGRRRVFKVWEEGRIPDVVFEVTSRGTSSIDQIDKPVIYERIGVREYFLYDPTASYLNPALQGFRLLEGVFVEIPPRNGEIECETLGFCLRLNGDELEFFDSTTRARLLTEAEAECHAKEFERQARELERVAREFERQAKEVERQARLAAEAQVRSLQAEIERLKKRQTGSE